MSYSRITRKTRADHVLKLMDLATNPGLQRERALAKLKEIKEDYAFSIPYGKHIARINGNGDPYVSASDRKTGKVGTDDGVNDFETEDESLTTDISRRFDDVIVAGSAPLNKTTGALHIPCGICVIVAGTGKGKTPLAHHLADLGVESYGTVRVGEPFAGYSTDHSRIAHDIGQAIVKDSDVVIDSIKDRLADGGNLMQGGISRGALTDLSTWAIRAAELGCTLYIPLNPSGDEELIAFMTQAAQSSASMTISHASGTKWSYSSRTGEGLERLSGTYDFTRSSNSTQARDDRETLLNFNASRLAKGALAGILNRSRTF